MPDEGATAVDTDADEPLGEEDRLTESNRSGSPRSLAAAWAGVLLAPGTIITGMVAAGGSAGPGFAVGFAVVLPQVHDLVHYYADATACNSW